MARILSGYLDLLMKEVGYKVDGDDETINGDEVDTLGYGGCTFYAYFAQGEVMAGCAMKIQQDTATGMGSAADLLGSSVTGATAVATPCQLMQDIKKPVERFLRAVLTVPNFGTARPVMVFAVLYNAESVPVTQVVTDSEGKVEPAEGTA